MKRVFSLTLCILMLATLVACGGGSVSGNADSNPDANVSDNADANVSGDADGNGAASGGNSADASPETISLRLWGAEQDQEYLAERVEAFKALYPDYNFDIQIGVESEGTARTTILSDAEAAADVYAFASDQLPDLVTAGAILELSQAEEALTALAGKSLAEVKAENVAAAVEAATLNGKLYAFPFSLDGYFLFYDPDYISAEQAGSWDAMLDAAQTAGKKVGMTLASGWYGAGFFYGAGFTTTLNADGSTVIDWNGTSKDGVTGVEVVKAMQHIAGHPAFMAIPDGGVSSAIASGELAAVVSGCWDSVTVEKIFGDDYQSGPMPLYTAGDKSIQTSSVISYKCMGVNPYSRNAGWAVVLAEFLTNEESQIARFEERELAPSNLAAMENPAVSVNKGVSGLSAQSAYATLQTVGGNYWTPTASFGEQIAQGTIGDDDASIQSALDALVEGVNAPVS